ncbi:uncharacterized protein PG998_003233 [Apiospora kogelbergensis]|uniref:uncharacterized protein n=1 Tax=Apiospora kogelbergensis TaxID=1337665 RepID=UPI00312D151D
MVQPAVCPSTPSVSVQHVRHNDHDDDNLRAWSRGRKRVGSRSSVLSRGAAPCASKNDAGWRRIIRNFTPSWFTVAMGTGIVSILLHNLPYNTEWIRWISVGFFALNVLLMVSFTTISVARYVLYPQIWGVMIRHPTQSLFLGTFPMGLATIINMTVFVCVPAWGNWAAYLAWGLWWFDLAISLLCCVSLPFMVIHLGKTNLASLTAVLLLPIVPCVVAAASGGIVANVLPNPSHVQTTLIASYMSWGIGVFFSVLVLAMYQVRLSNHALPPREAIVSVLLPVGPFGQGGFGIAKLTQVTRKLLLHGGEGTVMTATDYDTTYAEPIGLLIEGMGAFVALIMWGDRPGLARVCCYQHRHDEELPLQHGLVGIHLSPRGLGGVHCRVGIPATQQLFQCDGHDRLGLCASPLARRRGLHDQAGHLRGHVLCSMFEEFVERRAAG